MWVNEVCLENCWAARTLKESEGKVTEALQWSFRDYPTQCWMSYKVLVRGGGCDQGASTSWHKIQYRQSGEGKEGERTPPDTSSRLSVADSRLSWRYFSVSTARCSACVTTGFAYVSKSRCCVSLVSEAWWPMASCVNRVRKLRCVAFKIKGMRVGERGEK